jgi:ribosome-associated protein
VTAIAEHVERELRKQRIKPLSVEGAKEGQWVLLDYGSVVIHVFFESVREFYDLEGLWTDARRLKLPGAKRSKSANAFPLHPSNPDE